MNRKKIIYKVSFVTIIINSILCILKLICGIIGNSRSMISDAIHSISDTFTTIIVIISAKMVNKESDEEHPYGHERIECVFSVILSIILMLTGLYIGYKGLILIFNHKYINLPVPNIIALLSALISIIVKEIMYHYTMIYAKKINSTSLAADAHHHRSDALSSIGSLVGIFFAQRGLPVMDSIASVIICIFIFKSAIDIFKNAMNQMIDTACDNDTISRYRKTISRVDGVIKIDLLKTRQFASKVYIDVEISVDKDLSLIDAHNIAEDVHNTLEKRYPNIKHCMVHVNPYIEK